MIQLTQHRAPVVLAANAAYTVCALNDCDSAPSHLECATAVGNALAVLSEGPSNAVALQLPCSSLVSGSASEVQEAHSPSEVQASVCVVCRLCFCAQAVTVYSMSHSSAVRAECACIEFETLRRPPETVTWYRRYCLKNCLQEACMLFAGSKMYLNFTAGHAVEVITDWVNRCSSAVQHAV
eukprot:21303-Heterococcus_DN1.PRE.2